MREYAISSENFTSTKEEPEDETKDRLVFKSGRCCLEAAVERLRAVGQRDERCQQRLWKSVTRDPEQYRGGVPN